MTQNKISLQQLRQTLDDLRQTLEAVESALIEFEDQEALEKEGSEEEGAQAFRVGEALNCSPFRGLPGARDGQELGIPQAKERRDT